MLLSSDALLVRGVFAKDEGPVRTRVGNPKNFLDSFTYYYGYKVGNYDSCNAIYLLECNVCGVLFFGSATTSFKYGVYLCLYIQFSNSKCKHAIHNAEFQLQNVFATKKTRTLLFK